MNDITIICQDSDINDRKNNVIDMFYSKMRTRKLCINCQKYNGYGVNKFLISGCNNCAILYGPYKLCNDILCNTYMVAKNMYKCKAGCNRYYCYRHVVTCYSCGSKKCRACSNRHDDICEKKIKNRVMLYFFIKFSIHLSI